MNSAGGHRYNQGCGYRSDRVRNVFEVSRTEVNGFGFLYLWPDFWLRRFSIQIRTPIFDFRWFSIQNRIPILDDSLSRSQFSVKINVAYSDPNIRSRLFSIQIRIQDPKKIAMYYIGTVYKEVLWIASTATAQHFRRICTFSGYFRFYSVVDPKLFFSDPDSTFQEISDPDPISDPT